MEAELDLMVEVNGDYRKADKEYYDRNLQQWLPGDGDEITNFKIMIGKNEITNEVPLADRERLYEAYLKSKRKEHELQKW